MSRHDDTIAALATPAGTGALALVRMSGSDTRRIAGELTGGAPSPRRARHGDYRGRGGELLDDVVFTFYAAPCSYTGEDTLEISCHGNPFIAQKILEDLLARGCRPAEPGEFTQRAFLNGRMDLSQAEAVMDVIHARSERALASAQQQLRGGLGRRMSVMVDALLAVLAKVEAYIDFPDEDLPPEDRKGLGEELRRILLSINELAATRHYGELLRDGIKAVIFGAPNAGKSSLLNRLVGRDRALVSAEPGTTRDFIEERVMMGPHLLRLIDTAGLNPSPAALEKLGIEKTLERVQEADLFLWVVDGTLPSPPPLPAALIAQLRPGRAILVLNKADLAAASPAPVFISGLAGVRVSAVTGAGVEALRGELVTKADALSGGERDLVAINARHARALEQARESLESAEEKIGTGAPVELLASDLRAVLAAFGEITGRIDNERMLDQLFATFCIGK